MTLTPLQRLQLRIAAILTTVHDDGDTNNTHMACPRGPVHLALQVSGHSHEEICQTEDAMVKVGLLIVTSETLKLTPRGLEIAKELDAKIVKKV